MKPILAALLVAVAAAPVSSQDPIPAGVPPERAAAWTRFRAEHGAFTAEWCAATGTPAAIFGTGVPLHAGAVRTLDTARALARGLLAREATLLGGGASEWRESIAQTVGSLHVLVYDQYLHGLHVVGGRADVRVHEVGAASLFGAIAFTVPPHATAQPAVTPHDATLRAYAHLELAAPRGPLALFGATPPRLVWHGDRGALAPTPARLAWEVAIDAFDERKVGTCFIDARDGAVIRYENGLHECAFGCAHASEAREGATPAFAVAHEAPVPGLVNITGNVTAWLNKLPDANAAVQNVPLRGLKVVAVGVGQAFTDASGNFDIANAGTAPVTVQISWAGARRCAALTTVQGTAWSISTSATPGTPLAVQVFTQALGQLDRAQSTAYWCVDSVNEYMRGVLGTLPASTDLVTARVNIAQTCNAYYSSNSIHFYAAGGGCANTAFSTVVEHEWGHGLDDRYGGISQTDGLSEGWGDGIALYFTGQPGLGIGFQGSGPLRSGLNTRKLGDCTEVHCAGEVWMGFGWDVRVGLIGKLGQGPGVARAERIYLGSIVANAQSQNTAAREVFLLDDDDANLTNGTPNCAVLRQACTKRNLQNPAGNCSAVPAGYTLYGSACGGMLLVASGLPMAGSSFGVNLFSGVPGMPALLNFGVSKSTFLGLTLPLDLGPFHAPGCSVLASGEVGLASTTGPIGTTSAVVSIPNVAALAGARFYNQWLLVNPAANALGIVSSAGGEGTIGLP